MTDKRTDKKIYTWECWFCHSKQFTAEKYQTIEGIWNIGFSCYKCKEFLESFKDPFHETLEGVGLHKHGMEEVNDPISN